MECMRPAQINLGVDVEKPPRWGQTFRMLHLPGLNQQLRRNYVHLLSQGGGRGPECRKAASAPGSEFSSQCGQRYPVQHHGKGLDEARN